MTDESLAAGYLRAAADDLNDAKTSLSRAMDAAEVSVAKDLIDTHDEIVDDLEQTLSILASNVEVLESDADIDVDAVTESAQTESLGPIDGEVLETTFVDAGVVLVRVRKDGELYNETYEHTATEHVGEE